MMNTRTRKGNSMKGHPIILAWALLAAPLGAATATAEDTNTLELIRQLQRRIDELEQKVRTLEAGKPPPPAPTDKAGRPPLEQPGEQLKTPQAETGLGGEAAPARAGQAPKISLGENGLSFSSADDRFKFRVRGYIQADGRFYLDDQNHSATDTFLLNRARPVFEGTVFNNYDFKLMPDFGQGRASIQDAFLDARFLPWLNVRAGKYKGPVGLERLQSARDLIFVERALPTDLVPNREIGVALHGGFFNSALEYEAGIFNGSPDGASNDADENDSKDFEGRLFAYPFKRLEFEPLRGLAIGVAGTTGHENGTAPSYKTISQQTFFSYSPGVTANGTRNRIVPQAFYYWGPLGLLGEFVISSQDISSAGLHERLDHSAWQVAAFYVLTGEPASYTGVVPTRPFHPGQGQWGALELVARVSQLTIDPDAFRNLGTPAAPVFLANPASSASKATAFSAGLNWYLNRGVKFMVDYEHTQFDGGAPNGDRRDEHAILSRVQVVF